MKQGSADCRFKGLSFAPAGQRIKQGIKKTTKAVYSIPYFHWKEMCFEFPVYSLLKLTDKGV